MPGGWAHKPIWSPYALYGTIDYVYGLPAYESHDGFGGAQGAMNVLESLGYIWYLYLIWKYGVQAKVKGRGAPRVQGNGTVMEKLKELSRARVVTGRVAAGAPVLAFMVTVMTLAKTILYSEYSRQIMANTTRWRYVTLNGLTNTRSSLQCSMKPFLAFHTLDTIHSGVSSSCGSSQSQYQGILQISIKTRLTYQS